MLIESYQEKYKDQIIKLFDEFHRYICSLDPIKRNIPTSEFAEKYFSSSLKELSEKEGLFLIALDNDQVVGFIMGTIERPTEDDKVGVIPTLPGRITELYISENFRGQKVGTLLLEKLEDYFKEKECTIVRVEAAVFNEKAEEFYNKKGYYPRTIDNLKVLK